MIPRERILQTLKNKSWRLNHLYTIVDKKAKRRIFRQNVVQRMIAASPMRRRMVLKARQFGVSTNGLLSQLDFTIHNRNVNSCIIAHEQDSIKKLFRIILRAYEYLNPNFRPVIDRGGGSKYELYFPILNSRIYCDLESRGDTIHYLHVSEAAFIKDPDKLKATLQAVPIETGIVEIESTPNGMGNLFHDMWIDPDQPYAKLFFPWFIFPDYQIACDHALTLTEAEKEFTQKVKQIWQIDISHAQINFRRYKQKELGSLFQQEYPEDDTSCFLSSGASAMDLFLVTQHMAKRLPPSYQDHELKIYKPYVRGRTYVCGVDCAEGVDGDYSVAVIFDAQSREQCAVLRGHIKIHEFAEKVDALCRRYWSSGKPYPLLGVERNNHGHAVLLWLKETLMYPNLYQHPDEKYGWLTDKVTRPIMLDAFIEGVENRNCILHDTETFQECLTLIEEDGKIQAAPGKHDDCVIASAIGLQMCIQCAELAVYDNIREKILV